MRIAVPLLWCLIRARSMKPYVHKMVKHMLKILKQMLHDFQRECGHFAETRHCRVELSHIWSTTEKKRNSPLSISSVNVTKSTVPCAFGHIYWRIFNEKLHFCTVQMKLYFENGSSVKTFQKSLTHHSPVLLFYTPLKTSENLKV